MDCKGVSRAMRPRSRLFVKITGGSSAAAALLGSRTLGVIDQDLAHRPSGDGEEVCPVLPVWISLVGQTQISLVHQGRRLQGVIGALPLHKMMSEAPEFFVDQRG